MQLDTRSRMEPKTRTQRHSHDARCNCLRPRTRNGTIHGICTVTFQLNLMATRGNLLQAEWETTLPLIAVHNPLPHFCMYAYVYYSLPMLCACKLLLLAPLCDYHCIHDHCPCHACKHAHYACYLPSALLLSLLLLFPMGGRAAFAPLLSVRMAC